MVLIFIASLEFVLLLRHKSPYMSDSYFYQHMYYQMQGDSYDQAQSKILKKIDVDKLSDIEKNIFYHQDKYQYSLSRYIRRPFYPFAALLINVFIHNEYLAFLLPIYISYIGCIALTYGLFRFRFDVFWATLGTTLFMSFYPFLDWSTYFLTDTIGAFFWMLQVFFLVRYFEKPKFYTLIFYLVSLIISLTVREQSILMFLVITLMFVGFKLLKQKKYVLLNIKMPFIVTLAVVAVFLLINTILKFPTLYDSWIYLQSNFGYHELNYSPQDTANFLINELVRLHQGLVIELVHHRWWLIFTVLGFIGTFLLFFKNNKLRIIDMLMFVSGLVAYIGLLIVPYLTYRYFYPTIISLIYFGLYTIQHYFYPQSTNQGKTLNKGD